MNVYEQTSGLSGILQLQTLQKMEKWQSDQPNFQPDDIVLLKEVVPHRNSWPLARILETFPGKDGRVRVVRLLCNGHTYRRAIQKLVPLHGQGFQLLPPGVCSGLAPGKLRTICMQPHLLITALIIVL